MNGIGAVVFSGIESIEKADEVVEAARRLASAAPIDGLVVPGLTDEDVTAALLDALAEELEDDERTLRLWLDAPPEASADELHYRQSAFGHPGRVWVVGPWVRSVSPGRPSPERLPATCVVAPLAMGATSRLRGLHEVGAPYSFDQLRRLQSADALVLSASGRRRAVGLAWSPLRPAPVPPLAPPFQYGATIEPAQRPTPEHREEAPQTPHQGSGTEAPGSVVSFEEDDPVARRVADVISEASAGIVGDRPNNTRTWRTLERRVAALLRPLVESGVIAGFVVRCDAETNEGSASPVVEVRYQKVAEAPKELRVRVHPL